MTALIIPWTRPASVLPQRRSAMPTRGQVFQLGPGVRLVPFNSAGLPPHHHLDIDNAPEKRLIRIGEGEQTMTTRVPRALLPCETLGCSWYLLGHDGMDEGKPFHHPQGVNCGDDRGCTDDNCPCPGRVYEWRADEGPMRAHVAPCRFCDGTYRFTTARENRTVTFDEFFYRLDEGADALVTIRKRGL